MTSCPHCGKQFGNRYGIGPWPNTRRNAWTILVDKCYRCGWYTPVRPVTYQQARWLERSNRRMEGKP